MALNDRGKSFSVEEDQKFVLGIDVGTTSVKACIVDQVSKSIVAIQAKDTQANVPSECGTEGNKQDVPKIFSCVSQCVSRLPREMLKRVTCIGICGQMHGILFWKMGNGWHWNGEKLEPGPTSNLYTWQDNRCTVDFMSTLPCPDSHLKVCSGYGCATLFWMARNKPQRLECFDRAGSIQDYIVAMLCDLPVPIMSTQLAASWGYFNTEKKEWNIDILKSAGFPISFLPQITNAGKCAGKLHNTWHLVPEGTPVIAALGDFQCSVFSTLEKKNEASLNISTSAQLAFVMKDGFKPQKSLGPSLQERKIQYFPYFDDKYLAVAAALTGGNALAAFVRMLQQWGVELGCNVPQAKIWEKILSAGAAADPNCNLEIVPTIFGERHDPEQNASVMNIDLGNISLGKVTRALCRGIIQNLHEMMPSSMLTEAGITSVIGSGSALSRNPILQEEFVNIFKLDTKFGRGGDAAFGAALIAIKAISG